MKRYINQKSVLHVIEGFDYSDKDELLDYINTHYNDKSVYVYYKNIDKTTQPDFKNDPVGFINWMRPILENLTNELIELSDEYDIIIMQGLYVSDLLYSTLFNRKCITTKYSDLLRQYFTIINHIILFNTYDDYKKRCNILNKDIYYNNTDYNQINSLYKSYAKTGFYTYGDIYRLNQIKYFTSVKKLYTDFITYIESIHQTLFYRNINV